MKIRKDKINKNETQKLVSVHKTASVSNETIFGENVVIMENCKIEGNCKIGNNVTICENSVIKNCIIEDDVMVTNSHLEGSTIGKGTTVGPFARIRQNAVIKENCRIGNFVEIKNSIIETGTKIAHLAYVGDAEVGKNCNIGCGVIFVNYNGKIKQRTIVKDNCFIGSNCNLIAPLVVEEGSYICAGTTVTKNTESYDFVIGRVKQETKKEQAKKYLKEYKND